MKQEISLGKFLQKLPNFEFFYFNNIMHGSWWPTNTSPLDVLNDIFVPPLFVGLSSSCINMYEISCFRGFNQKGEECSIEVHVMKKRLEYSSEIHIDGRRHITPGMEWVASLQARNFKNAR